jgi:hypothetical protein
MRAYAYNKYIDNLRYINIKKVIVCSLPTADVCADADTKER